MTTTLPPATPLWYSGELTAWLSLQEEAKEQIAQVVAAIKEGGEVTLAACKSKCCTKTGCLDTVDLHFRFVTPSNGVLSLSYTAFSSLCQCISDGQRIILLASQYVQSLLSCFTHQPLTMSTTSAD